MVTWPAICREPYRLLFPLGTLFGCLGVSHWLFYALQWSSASTMFHASIQMSAYMYCFIAGFLMTALPRFASAPPASSREMLGVLGLLAANLASLVAGWWHAAQLCTMGLLLALVLFAGRRFLQRRGPAAGAPPVEFLWIPAGAVMGLLGSALLMAGLPAIGKPMAYQGFVVAVVMGVAGFMAPRLMGREISLAAPAGPEQACRIRRRRLWLHGVAAAGLLASFVIEGAGSVRPAYVLRALLVTAELAWTAQPHRRPRATELYARLVWVSLWMVFLGFWGAAFWPRYRIAMLHLVFLGGFSLMAFAVATMVVFAHAGAAERLRRPLPMLRGLAAALGVAVIARVAADLRPAWYFPLLGVASIAWLCGAAGWLAMIVPYVLSAAPDDGAFERAHEAAKRHLRAASA